MSEDDLAGWALPAFDATKALQQLQRALRDAKLAERGPRWLLGGREVAELVLDGGTVRARLAQRPALTPAWDDTRISTTTAQRRWLDECMRRLARWQDEA
jgi:hypothetical protein